MKVKASKRSMPFLSSLEVICSGRYPTGSNILFIRHYPPFVLD